MSSIRVRFAPSPTGYLHLGNLRTALFNDLFARHEGGKMILRIEDTDTVRSKREYGEAIQRDLESLGIRFDEGPYYQSERIAVYEEHLRQLEKKGNVYLCYCTQDELEARRREALAMKRPPRYDNRCRTLTDEERRRRIAQGVRPTLRFKVEVTEPILVEDVIRGEIKFDPQEIGDFVIMRSDPDHSNRFLPTFHMSVCVDDGLMKITHVIRGEDHLSNSPRHVLLFRALGFPTPQFAHLSLIHGPGGEPLSKRYGDVSLSDFIENKGYVPEAIRNYLALLGWSPKDNREIFSMTELEQSFDLRNATHHAAIFTEQKLTWINSEHLKMLSEADYLKRAFFFLERRGIGVRKEPKMREALAILKSDIHRFDELPDALSFFDEEAYRNRLKRSVAAGDRDHVYVILTEGRSVLEAAQEAVQQSSSEGEALFLELTETLKHRVSEKGKKLFLPLRAALTGEPHGIELKRIFQLLDRQTILGRIGKAQEFVTSK